MPLDPKDAWILLIFSKLSFRAWQFCQKLPYQPELFDAHQSQSLCKISVQTRFRNSINWLDGKFSLLWCFDRKIEEGWFNDCCRVWMKNRPNILPSLSIGQTRKRAGVVRPWTCVVVASNGAGAEPRLKAEREGGVQISMKAQQMRWEPRMPRRRRWRIMNGRYRRQALRL